MGQAQEPDFSLIPFYYLPLYIHCQSILYKLYSLYNDNTKLSVHDIKGDKGRGRLFYKLDSSVKIITIMQQFYTTYIIFWYEIILLSKIPIIDRVSVFPNLNFGGIILKMSALQRLDYTNDTNQPIYVPHVYNYCTFWLHLRCMSWDCFSDISLPHYSALLMQ